MEVEIWSLLSSTYRHGNTDRPTFTWVWIIATVFFSFLLLVKFKKSLSFVLWNALKEKIVIQQKCSLFATDSRISTDEEVSFRSVTSSPIFRFLFTQTSIGNPKLRLEFLSVSLPNFTLIESANYYRRNCEWCNGLFLLRSWKKLKRTRARERWAGAVAFDRLYANAKCQMPKG